MEINVRATLRESGLVEKTGKLCELIFPPRDTVVAARNRYKEARSTNY